MAGRMSDKEKVDSSPFFQFSPPSSSLSILRYPIHYCVPIDYLNSVLFSSPCTQGQSLKFEKHSYEATAVGRNCSTLAIYTSKRNTGMGCIINVSIIDAGRINFVKNFNHINVHLVTYPCHKDVVNFAWVYSRGSKRLPIFFPLTRKGIAILSDI